MSVTKKATPDEAALDSFASQQYRAGVLVLRRTKPAAGRSARVNVYVDGVLTTMSEDALHHLIDIGFYTVVTVRPGT